MRKSSAATYDAILFDLGNVLIEWDPRHLYRKLFDGDETSMEHFLATVCTAEWNRQMDAGKPFAEAVAELQQVHPDQSALIAAWHLRWDETLGGAIEGSVQILAELRKRGHRLYALTNWSAETFPVARRRFDFLSWFEAIVVSGEVGMSKPDPDIFELALERFRLTPARTLFIDDSEVNVATAQRLGVHAVHFQNAHQLQAVLSGVGVLD
ncbi:MAG: HAD family phosphatase [Gammaproteobacteria bacterium]|nr:HAD family phosphatase [Gammaproteobacteria bacterium]